MLYMLSMMLASGTRRKFDASHGLSSRAVSVEGVGGDVEGNGDGVLAVDGAVLHQHT